MNGVWGDLQVALALSGAGVLFSLEAAYSVTVASSAALSRVALHRLSTEGGKPAAYLETLRDPLSTHRTALHLGRQLCLLGGALLLVRACSGLGWPHAALWGVFVAALVGVLLLELLLVRIVAAWDPRAALRRTGFIVRPTHALLYPLVCPVHALLHRIERPATEEERDEQEDEEVEAYIEVGEREGILEADEGKMMRSIVDLDETVVREIMTPRPDIVAIAEETTIEQARRTFLETGHSRLPVYRESVDEIVGVLHVRDLLRATDGGKGDGWIARFMRDAMFVPESLSVAELLSEMRLKTHMALVVDEYGGTSGLVTLEDLVEEIVGEIRDEHEEEETDLREQPDGSWIINAAVHVEQLEELFGIQLGDREFDTVGGLVVSELGRLPAAGDEFEFQNLRIEVLEVEGRRIREVRIRPRCARAEL